MIGAAVERFEYELSLHDSEAFRRVVYFCSDLGDCKLEEVPVNEPQVLTDLLNERGRDGWELVQLLFGTEGLMACWKRRLSP